LEEDMGIKRPVSEEYLAMQDAAAGEGAGSKESIQLLVVFGRAF